jgi:hypothetical protein
MGSSKNYRCLGLEDGELSLELLPELQELTYFGSGDTGDAFTPLIDARQNAGRPVTLICYGTSPGPITLSFEQEPPVIPPTTER